VPAIRVRLLDRFQTFLAGETYARARPWLAVCGLWLLFDAPTVIRSGGLSLIGVRPSGDLLVLLTLAALSGRFPWTRLVRVVLVAYATLLVVIRLDYVIFMLLMRDEPLLYDQVLMVRHLLVLISDLWNPATALATFAILASVISLPWAIKRLLRVASELMQPSRLEGTARVGYAMWLVVMLLTSIHAIGLTARPLVAWVSPNFADNIVRSRQTYRAIARGIERPAYKELDQIHLPADKRPDVLLLLVESYGRLMFTNQDLKTEHLARLTAMEAKLGAAGWHGVSALSRSTVSGGRSWLAEASILLGTPVMHEAVFQHLTANTGRLPNLVSFLDKQGYQTILLAAADRERPGIKAANPYRYQHYVDYATLKYRGRPYGWGIVPDQFSLGFAQERLLDKAKGPVFLNAHLMTSHAPWKEIPPLVDDWHTLNAIPTVTPVEPETKGSTVVLRGLRRYQRGSGQKAWYMGGLNDTLRRDYGNAIDYELTLITDFLSARTRDAIVIVMGDHQPPVIPKRFDKFDVPVHVFARDPGLLKEFRRQGYAPGLVPTKMVTSHAGLLSLITRALAGQPGTGQKRPRYRPEGVSLLRE